MRLLAYFSILFPLIFSCFPDMQAAPDDLFAQDDTVMVTEIVTPPVFDGTGDDNCWQGISWQPIDQVWIPWGATMDPEDFSGRYKIVWSGQHNLLYFLLEITDDIESDAYQHDGSTAAIYNFDMFEVFIDEDKSGGPHVFTTPENAFAYHTFTRFPESGETTTTFVCDDMGSDYRSHFPDFILRKDGDVATWEFSLIVYNDTYTVENEEAARSVLEEGKIIGLSVAYNDDDEPGIDPALTERDNFIGSVAVSEAAYNDHWHNADDFGTLKLVGGADGLASARWGGNDAISVYPNPTNGCFTLELENDYRGEIEVLITDTGGKEISRSVAYKTEPRFRTVVDVQQEAGLLFARIICGPDIYAEPVRVSGR